MPRKHKRPVRKQPPTLLILIGIALLVIAVFALKSGSNAPASAASLEAELNQALKDGRPTFVFLHSLDCIPCKEMMGVVADVYPEFQDSVVLIDVDVYDQRNINILRRESLQVIPTLVIYDRQGRRQIFVGVMQAEQLRDTLQAISTGN